MKKFFIFLFVFTAALLRADIYKVRVAQVEELRNAAYFPDVSAASGVSIEDGSPSTHAVDNGISDHATQVLRLLTSGNAKGLVGAVVEIEAGSFGYPARATTIFSDGTVVPGNPYGLNAGRTFAPSASNWDIENHSWGGYDPLWDNDIIAREVTRIERDNVLAFIALADPGLVAANGQNYRQLQACKSRNVIRVGSSVSGQITTAEFTYDVLAPVQYTSFACPTVEQTGAAMISALKTAGITYNASDLGDIIRAVAKANGMNHDHAGCMKALALKYPALSPVSAPVVAPVVTPISAPTTTSTSTTTIPTTTVPQVVVSNSLPKITSFGHWNSAWASASTPSTLHWSTTGADTVTLMDPMHKSVVVAANGSIVISTGSSGADWYLDAHNNAGDVTAHDQVHGQFAK